MIYRHISFFRYYINEVGSLDLPSIMPSSPVYLYPPPPMAKYYLLIVLQIVSILVCYNNKKKVFHFRLHKSNEILFIRLDDNIIEET